MGGSAGGGQSGEIRFGQIQAQAFVQALYGPEVWVDGSQPAMRAYYGVSTEEQNGITVYGSDGDYFAIPKTTDSGVLDSTLTGLIRTLNTQNSPYYGEEAVSPDEKISAVGTKADSFYTQLDLLDPDVDVLSFVDQAVDKVDDKVIAAVDQDIEDEVFDYEEGSRLTFLRAYNRLTGPMAELNAVNGSAFQIGISMLEQARAQDINHFRTRLRRERQQQRMQMIDSITQKILTTHMAQLELKRGAAFLEIDRRRFQHVSEVEEQQQNLDYDVKDLMWDFEPYRHLGNFLGSIAGSVVPGQNNPDKTGSVLGNMVSFGAAGAMIGNMFAPAGASALAGGTALTAASAPAGFMGPLAASGMAGGPIGLGIGAALGGLMTFLD